MTTLFLLRHGRSTANSAGVLAGRLPGVQLDDIGHGQAADAAQRLSAVRLAAMVSSPLERCQQTIAAVAAGRRRKVRTDERFVEAHYGSWTGKKLAALTKEALWSAVQAHPSAVRFPGRGGESMVEMSARAVDGVRAINAKLAPQDNWLLCSHGDVIKAILADALGMHLDDFQRIGVDPASVSVINYTPLRPFVLTMNSSFGDLAGYAGAAGSSEAVPGGATGNPHSGHPRNTAPRNTAKATRRSNPAMTT